MKNFWMPNLKIYWLPKNFLWKSSQLVHIVVKELVRLLNDLAKQLFCWWDISRVQLKSNWTVVEGFLVSDQEAIREWRLNLLKGKWTFLQCLISKVIHLKKDFTDGVLSLYTGYSRNSSDCQMALWTYNFVDRTFQGSNWTVGERLLGSDQSQFDNAG